MNDSMFLIGALFLVEGVILLLLLAFAWCVWRKD